MDRWCIDPLDPECPATAPNAFKRCGAFKKFRTWNMTLPENEKIFLKPEITTKTTMDQAQSEDATLKIIDEIFG